MTSEPWVRDRDLSDLHPRALIHGQVAALYTRLRDSAPDMFDAVGFNDPDCTRAFTYGPSPLRAVPDTP